MERQQQVGERRDKDNPRGEFGVQLLEEADFVSSNLPLIKSCLLRTLSSSSSQGTPSERQRTASSVQQLETRIDYPNEDVFDVMSDVLRDYGAGDYVYSRLITEYTREDDPDEKTLEIYVAWGTQEIELNQMMTSAMRNYFDTDEAFDVYGNCIVFALWNDTPVDFTIKYFNLLFFQL